MQKNKIYTPLFYFPALILYVIFFIFPVVTSFYYSLTNWNSYSSEIKFVGLKNFQEIFSFSGPYVDSISHTLIFTLITVILKTVIGLLFALLLNRKIRTRNIIRALYFIPYILSPLIIGILFKSILSQSGLLNSFFNSIGLNCFTKGWLSDPKYALYSTMMVEVWRMVGWNMVIFLAGLQMIDKTYYEAASIDGANSFKKFTNITIPQLLPTLVTATVLNTIHGLKTFDLIFVLTGGGPASSTEVINTYVFKEFSDGRYGMSTALGLVIFIFTAIFVLIMRKSLLGEED